MDHNYPKYSVLMSVYAKEKPEYLQISIQSMLNQTVPPDEFVLVEDGPLPAGLKKAIENFVEEHPKLFHIVLLPENMGLGLALATGVQECRNELVARMDSDDYSAPERCRKELECFLQDPGLDMVACNIKEFFSNISSVTACRVMPEKQEEILRYAKRRCPLIHPTILFKKSSVLRCGSYRKIQCEDYDLIVRMLQNGCRCYNVQEFLFFVRVDREVYKRRGGIRYMRTLVAFRKYMYRSGFSSFSDFLISAGGQAAVCLMPGWLRGFFYKTFLRNKV